MYLVFNELSWIIPHAISTGFLTLIRESMTAVTQARPLHEWFSRRVEDIKRVLDCAFTEWPLDYMSLSSLSSSLSVLSRSATLPRLTPF